MNEKEETELKINPDDFGSFVVDVTPYLNADKTGLTPEGRAQLLAELVAKMRNVVPNMSDSTANRIAHHLAERGERAFLNQTNTTHIQTRLTEMATELDAMMNDLMHMARALSSKDASGNAPHVFMLGQSAGNIETAVDALRAARGGVHTVTGCACGATSKESLAPDGSKAN